MRIVGIDPGVQATGYGVVSLMGRRVSPVIFGAIGGLRGPLPLRLLKIHTGLKRLFRKFRPDCLAVEDLFYGKNARSLIKSGEGRGIVLLVAAEMNLPVAEYAPAEIKQAVTGSGRADKTQVQQMVRVLLGLKECPQPTHAEDALAVALCHAFRQKSAVSNQPLAVSDQPSAIRKLKAIWHDIAKAKPSVLQR